VILIPFLKHRPPQLPRGPSPIARSATFLLAIAAVTAAAETPTPPRRTVRPVDLEPRAASQAAGAPASSATQVGDWQITAERADPAEGVPWRLMARPLSQLATRLQPGDVFRTAALAESIPVIEVPAQLWGRWFDADMNDVVGIHYHECQVGGPARVLVTVHQFPAEPRDGLKPGEHRERTGTRLEATLLTPLAIYLDQSVVVRAEGIGVVRGAERRPHTEVPPDRPVIGKKPRDQQGGAAGRVIHERGHAELSIQMLIATLAGPQTWSPRECSGQRSTIAFYWESSRTQRPWEGFHGGAGKLYTQRITIHLTPPTRWSLLIPLPPDEVTQRQIEQFNDWAVLPQSRFVDLDREAQKRFHALHGEFEGCD